jgi:hypothetical protein
MALETAEAIEPGKYLNDLLSHKRDYPLTFFNTVTHPRLSPRELILLKAPWPPAFIP